MFIFIFRLATIKGAIQDVPVVKRTEQDVGQDYLEMYGTGDYVLQSDFPTSTVESPSPEAATCAPPLPAKLRYFIFNSFRHCQLTIFLSFFFFKKKKISNLVEVINKFFFTGINPLL